MKKHYSPGIPVLINQNKYDGKSAFIYLGSKYKNKKNFFSLSNTSNLNIAASNLYKIFRMIKNNGYKKIQIGKIPNKGSKAIGTSEATGIGTASVIHHVAVSQAIPSVIAPCRSIPEKSAIQKITNADTGANQRAIVFTRDMTVRK